MQCPSCQFENMPGSGRCARCGASLALTTAAIDVHPPRAGRMSRFELAYWRVWHAIGRVGSKASSFVPAFESRIPTMRLDLGTMLRCIIPGWPQFYCGDRQRAFVFLFSYFCLLLPGAVLAGTWLGSLLLGLAGAMHVASVCDAVVTKFATPSDRVAYALVGGFVLCFVWYLPVGWLILRVATPISINQTIPPFQQGDVLWYSRVSTPSRGDLIVITLPGITAGNYAFQGQWIARVIAIPGQTVSVDKGHWLVNGVTNEWQLPLHPSLSEGYSCVVPDGHLYVYPDGLVPVAAPVNREILQSIYVVPMTRIAGRLYFRSLPFSQMTTL